MKIQRMLAAIGRFSFSIMFMLPWYSVTATPVFAGTGDEVGNVAFWLKNLQNPDAVVMKTGEITRYNQEMLSKLPNTVYDLKNYPRAINGQDLQKFLQENELPDGYVNGQKLTLDGKQHILDKVNRAAVQAKNHVRWAVTVRRSSLRLYPTQDGIFDDPNDHDFDSLQVTIINPGEALAIIHKSTDDKWFFVQSTNYRGWILADNVAETSYEEWRKWQSPETFLVVVAASINIQTDSEKVLLEMGTCLPVIGRQENDYIVQLPQRQDNGQVRLISRTVPADDTVHLGYLPYTRANIIQQAFKFYGQPYGWGGLKNSVDCSSLVMDIYRCFGFMMPRDADTQEVVVGKVKSVDPQHVKAVLDQTLPGATLHMDGHVMLYLGRIDDRCYVIHSLGSYGDRSHAGSDGLLARVAVMRVVTTDITHTKRRNGKSFMESIRTVKDWRY